MSKSLQDQLLALGLAKGKANTSGKPKPPAGKKQGDQSTHRGRAVTASRAAKTSRSGQDISLEQAYRIRENLEKSEKQRLHELKLEEDRRRAALNREIRQIVEAGRLNLPDALEARYFMYKGRIRKIHVSAEQLQELNEGSLGVVYLAGGYHLLTADGVEAVRKLSPAHVPELLVGEADDEEWWAAASAAPDEFRVQSESGNAGVSGNEPGADLPAEPAGDECGQQPGKPTA